MGKKEYDLDIRTSKERERLFEQEEISLWLDSYNDLFSDFDPREYSQRALSDDFLEEAKKASADKKIGKRLNLRFSIHPKKRDLQHEEIIKQRLRSHFFKHFNLLLEEKIKILRRGLLFVILGIILMGLATFILFYYEDKTILINFLIVFLEPAGWFFFWEGLGLIMFEAKKRKTDIEFYQKMSEANILFTASHKEE